MTALARIPQGGRVLALRFSSFGDVVLAAAALRELKRQRPDLQVVLCTKRQFAPLFAGQAWLSVWPFDPEQGARGLWRLAGRIRQWRPHLIADLHKTLRAHFLRLLLPFAHWRRIKKRSLRRWLTVRLKLSDPAAGHIVERYGAVLGVKPEPVAAWFDVVAAKQTGLLALIPGAAWPTKRWQHERWLNVAAWWQSRGGSICWVGGEAERADLEAAAASVGGDVWLGLPLDQLAEQMATASAAVANDTGPAHLASAVGVPVVSILGPTVQSFGFAPWGRHKVVEVNGLECRPCSFHGSGVCPLGHHRCMLEITPSQVIAAIAAMTGR